MGYYILPVVCQECGVVANVARGYCGNCGTDLMEVFG